MSVSDSFVFSPSLSVRMANGINWSWKNGADVINNSWGDKGTGELYSSFLENAIHNALDSGRNRKGSVVVFAAGNSGGRPVGGGAGGVDYPGNFFPDLLTVGAIGSNGERAHFSRAGSPLDVVAPGVGILSTALNNSLISNNGTSFAAPHASGVATLILSVNPCLTQKEAVSVIERTCNKEIPFPYAGINGFYQDIPHRLNGKHTEEYGYGLINAHDAVKMAQQMYKPNADLFTRDDLGDIGAEGPNGTGSNFDKGPDIWVRNQADGFTVQTHENPDYSPNQPCYVYVRVHNKGCQASAGTEKMNVYWTKKSSWSSWPQNWDGTDPSMGNKIGTLAIPALQPGEDTILAFPWTPNSPANGQYVHVCLLTRIDNAPNDVITVYPNRLDQDIPLNNNISIRNVTVVDVNPNFAPYPGTPVLVGNVLSVARAFNVKMQVPSYGATGIADVTREAEVRIDFDSLGWALFQQTGQFAQEGIRELEPEHAIIISEPDVTLAGVVFPPNTRVPLTVSFHFLTGEMTDHTSFEWRLSQSFSDTPGVMLGAETFLIHRGEREQFRANAGPDKATQNATPVTLSAESIGEVATYNWYNQNGDLVYTGKDLTVSPAVSQKYRLEVISSLDGYKDYDSVEVLVKNRYIASMSPNPATLSTTLTMVLDSAASAYVMVLPASGGTGSNHILNVSQTQFTLSTSNLVPGSYSVVLVCNGEIADTKQLQIQ